MNEGKALISAKTILDPNPRIRKVAKVSRYLTQTHTHVKHSSTRTLPQSIHEGKRRNFDMET